MLAGIVISKSTIITAHSKNGQTENSDITGSFLFDSRKTIMNEQQFKDRTKQLALRIIRLAEVLPPGRSSDVIGKQIVRSVTSVGANYRAACRGRSDRMMIAKLDIVLEEADETLFWLELLAEFGLIPHNRLGELMTETDEIVAITVASLRTLRSKQK